MDEHLARVVKVAQSEGYVTLITADHGNLEVLRTAEGKPHVSHTSNLVPFILIDLAANNDIQLDDGSLRISLHYSEHHGHRNMLPWLAPLL